MTGTNALALALGAACGLGLLTIVIGMRGLDHARGFRASRVRSAIGRLWGLAGPRTAAGVGAGAVAGVVTGWVVGAALTTVGVWTLPRLLGRDTEHARRTARIEAIATWAEMLRDTLAAAAGLEQTILATAPAAPDPIRSDVESLADRLKRGETLGKALRDLADRLQDPTADLVVAALVLAAERQARELGALLGSLARAARDHAAMRMRIAAGRARVRTSIRVIVGATLAMAGGLVLLNDSYLHPYSTPVGQLVLLAVGACFAAAFAWLARIARIDEPERVLVRLSTRVHAPGSQP